MFYLQQNKIECNLYNQDIGFFLSFCLADWASFFFNRKISKTLDKSLVEKIAFKQISYMALTSARCGLTWT
jgi:hypothetical protein